MKQLMASLASRDQSEEQHRDTKDPKPFFKFKKLGQDFVSLNKSLVKAFVSHLPAEESLEKLLLEADARKSLQKSKLRRSLVFLSNKLAVEVAKRDRKSMLDVKKLYVIMKESLLLLSTLQELLGFSHGIEETTTKHRLPSRDEKRPTKMIKAKMSIRKSHNQTIESQKAEALDEGELRKRSELLSKDFIRRPSKVKPSKVFLLDQLMAATVQCLIDISIFAEW